jgi:hypothetical protein
MPILEKVILAFRKALEKVRQANNVIRAAYEEGTHK